MGTFSTNVIFDQMSRIRFHVTAYLLTGDRRQARHFYLAKQFCFLDGDCLVVGESQGSSRRSVGKYPVKPPRPEGDNQNIGTYRCKNFFQ